MSNNQEEAPPSYEEATGNTPPETLEPIHDEAPSTSESASGITQESSNDEKTKYDKAEEAGWRQEVLPSVPPSSANMESLNLMEPTPMVLPPGLQPLLTLDTLFLRGMYERGKGRRYRITNKNGIAVLYARSSRRGHHHPKSFQLYDSSRTAEVGQLTFSLAADNALYCSLECPARIPLATLRSEGSPGGINYTICNVLGNPVFTASSPPPMDSEQQIKIYSVTSPGTAVADVWWNFDEMVDAVEETQSVFGEKDETLAERRIKINFPIDLEVKMKAALLALCLLKDKIDHRMSKGNESLSDAFGGQSRDPIAITFGHRSRRRHFKH